MSHLKKEIRIRSMAYHVDNDINVWGDYDCLELVLTREYLSEDEYFDTKGYRLAKRTDNKSSFKPITEEQFKTALGNVFFKISQEILVELTE